MDNVHVLFCCQMMMRSMASREAGEEGEKGEQIEGWLRCFVVIRSLNSLRSINRKGATT